MTAMPDRLECPRCGRTMHAGFVMDHTGSSAGVAPHWVEGAPEKSFWAAP